MAGGAIAPGKNLGIGRLGYVDDLGRPDPSRAQHDFMLLPEIPWAARSGTAISSVLAPSERDCSKAKWSGVCPEWSRLQVAPGPAWSATVWPPGPDGPGGPGTFHSLGVWKGSTQRATQWAGKKRLRALFPKRNSVILPGPAGPPGPTLNHWAFFALHPDQWSRMVRVPRTDC
jgi:hypothetical protein